ncbi:DUF433 domain-containing protein [Brunnivagina elsteri]|uniref:DUF433 domain-containing protein n=1 Tax=Brunnivagina elsteri CCALA 953 TaxID=987040 RepID=A0A2A2TIM5_9CYAN|nr:DUF433 domain-containing protein [Calothrix elsteri]PAX53868.1 hypothetical protein CK510_13100 [Calothrix elsteri CCALA 953]
MTLKELEKQLLALTTVEKTQAIQILVQSLTNTWQGIEKTPGVCGGDACIVSTRIPIWSLVNNRDLGMSDAEILKAFPSLSAVDLANSWAYANAHKIEIEEAIRENDEVMREN